MYNLFARTVISICGLILCGEALAVSPASVPTLSFKVSPLIADLSMSGGGATNIIDHPDFGWRRTWTEQPQWGGRIGYVDSNGTLRIRMSSTTNPQWVVVAHNIKEFQLLDWRIAALGKDDKLLFAEGPISTPLKEIEHDVAGFQMTLTRIGILRNDGTFLIKEHGFLPQKIATGVKAFQVLLDRVALLSYEGQLWVHPRGAIRNFIKVADNVEKFQLERECIAIVQTTKSGNRLKVAKGELIKNGKIIDFIELTFPPETLPLQS